MLNIENWFIGAQVIVHLVEIVSALCKYSSELLVHRELVHINWNSYALFAEIDKNGLFGYARNLDASRMGLRKFKENSPDTFFYWVLGSLRSRDFIARVHV